MNDKPSVIHWAKFLAQHPNVEFVWLQTLSYRAATLTRILPVAKFTEMVKTSKYLSMPNAIFYLAPGDRLADGGARSLTGSFSLRPDLSTAYCQAGSQGTRVVIHCDSIHKDSETPLKECARSCLQHLDTTIQREADVSILVGFEIEVIFMRPSKDPQTETTSYHPISHNHSYSTITPEDLDHLDLIETIIRSTTETGTPLDVIHAEASPGQWEFVLPPSTPVHAVDNLLKARDTIRHVARSFGLHATLHPRPSRQQAGSGAHVHISVNDTHNSPSYSKRIAESFFAGIIAHMPSILAFTLAQEPSYERVATGLFSGGEYACWGWENKEAALRRIEDSRFEIKLMDGLANPYLALAALLSAGLDGMARKMPLTAGPVSVVPADLSQSEKDELGIKTLLPKTLEESLTALEADRVLCDLLGEEITTVYALVKRDEDRALKEMGDEARRNWLISRY